MSDNLPTTGTNVPLTVLAGIQPTFTSEIAIGTNRIPQNKVSTGYWFMVVDLTTLAVTAQAVSSDTTTVPSEIQPYLGQPNQLLIFLTMVTSFDQVPQGALFTALKTAGAGVLLDKAEQIYTSLGTGYFTYFGYILACSAESDGNPGFEEFSYTDSNLVLTIQLMPVTVDGKTIYTPIALD